MQNLSRKKVILGTKSIAYIGVLIALSSVTNAYSIETGIMSISFNYLVFFVAGYFMGPVAGIFLLIAAYRLNHMDFSKKD